MHGNSCIDDVAGESVSLPCCKFATPHTAIRRLQILRARRVQRQGAAHWQSFPEAQRMHAGPVSRQARRYPHGGPAQTRKQQPARQSSLPGRQGHSLHAGRRAGGRAGNAPGSKGCSGAPPAPAQPPTDPRPRYPQVAVHAAHGDRERALGWAGAPSNFGASIHRSATPWGLFVTCNLEQTYKYII